MKKILIVLLVLISSCAAPKKCCSQIDLKKAFKFSTFYGAINGNTSISDVETFSVTEGLTVNTVKHLTIITLQLVYVK